jgi:hypothetical protein
MTGPYPPHDGGDHPAQPPRGQPPYAAYPPPPPNYRPPAPGYPSPVYGPPTPGYWAPPPGYEPPPAYGTPPPGYGPPPAYGTPPPGYGPPPPWAAPLPGGTAAPGRQRGLAGKIWPKLAAGLGVLVAVCTFALVRAGLNGWLGAADERGQANPTASQSGGVSATSTATGPFAGTPAADYAEGVAGITLPKAAATGLFTAKQVGDALAGVKKVLIAGRLDSQMLVNRNPEPFLKLVAPDDRTLLRKDFASHDSSVFVTQFAPGTKPAREAPRVKGRITYRATTTDGYQALEITTNFVWVYPFQVSGGGPGDNLVVVHDELVWHFLRPAEVAKSSRGLWLDRGESYASNVDCDQYRKGFIAPGKPKAGPGTEDPDVIFDPEGSLDLPTTC